MKNCDDYNRVQNEKPWMHGMAGVLGGAIAMSMFYPLDFLRTRMHTLHQGSRARPLRSASEIIHAEGLKSMYRGICVSVISHSIGWGLYLLAFRAARKRFELIFDNNVNSYNSINESSSRSNTSSRSSGSTGLSSSFDEKEQKTKWRVLTTSLKDFLSACVAALITGTVITPLHVIKTRRQLYDAAIDRHHLFVHQPKGIYGVKEIISHEGWGAMFRGWSPQIVLTGSTTLQVTIYECFRRYCFTDHTDPSPWQVAVASAFAKAVSTTVFNPLEVVRTRLQDRRNAGSREYGSMWSGIQTIWRTEGMLGLYRGLPVNVLRVIPSTVMAFVLYEKCLHGIRSMYEQIASHVE